MKKTIAVSVAVLSLFHALCFAGSPGSVTKQPDQDYARQAATLSEEPGVSKEYLAEQKVKMLPSSHGDTLDSYLTNMARIPLAQDLGWQVYPVSDGFEVERSILIKNTQIIRYKWKVLHSGEVSPADDKARSLMK